MTPAAAAIHAAKNAPRWGVFAATRYALNRGASLSLWLAAYRNESRRRCRAAFAGYLA